MKVVVASLPAAFAGIVIDKVLEKLSAMVSEKLEGFAKRDFRYGVPAMIIVCHRKDCTVGPPLFFTFFF